MIYNEDCKITMARMEPKSVDVILKVSVRNPIGFSQWDE